MWGGCGEDGVGFGRRVCGYENRIESEFVGGDGRGMKKGERWGRSWSLREETMTRGGGVTVSVTRCV
jgi:hypothetical protein